MSFRAESNDRVRWAERDRAKALMIHPRHTAPYFHDNSSKTLEEVAEQYEFMFRTEAGINLTPQDQADIVAFLKLL